jgi:hypothetical protein
MVLINGCSYHAPLSAADAPWDAEAIDEGAEPFCPEGLLERRRTDAAATPAGDGDVVACIVADSKVGHITFGGPAVDNGRASLADGSRRTKITSGVIR